MHSRDRSAPRPGTPRRSRSGPPTVGSTPGPSPLPLGHPAALAALVIAAGCVLFSVTFRIIDTDFWQHLAVGRALWETRTIPHTQVWTWANFGAPDVLPSWLFRVLLWPFWQAGELTGLFAWRWLTTLAAFAVAWVAARRMGARGLSTLVVIVCCALVYRQRSQVRPETLAAILLALTIWLLETRRRAVVGSASGPDRSWALVAVAWVWANAHISYFLLFVLLAIHLVDALIVARRHGDSGSGIRRLWLVTIACVAVSFLNPFGWSALWQPFDYLLHVRDTALFQGIGELRAVGWSGNETNGAFLLLAGWPLLIIWRARRTGIDVAEALTCLFFTAYALPAQRFLSVYAVAAAPYVARDLDAWVGSRPWPRWTRPAWARAGLAAIACLALAVPEWARPDNPLRPGIGIDWTRYPIAACDFMESHDVRGKGFNQGRTGGYMIWRFWPDRSRLPFMDIHQGVSAEDRERYAAVFTDARHWDDLDRHHRFDYVLLDRRQYGDDRLYDHLDTDPAWALVFADDAAVLYLRRDGPQAATAESLAYRVPAGGDGVARLRTAWRENSVLRVRARADLERQVASSPFASRARSLLADLALDEGRFADARTHLERALTIDPATKGAHARLGMVAMWERDPARATRELERERALAGSSVTLEIALGFAREAAGDRKAAARHYRAALRMEPGNARAQELLDVLERVTGR